MGSLLRILSWIWSKIGKNVEVFLSHYGLPVASVALVGALVCVYFWVSQVETILSFSAQAFGQEREPVAQRFSALESLLLSGFEKPLEERNVSNQARLIFEAIDRKLTKLTPQDTAGVAQQLQLAPEANPSSLQAQYLTSAGSHEAGAASTGSRPAFSLFVPAILLPTDPAKTDEATTALTQNELAKILARVPQLETDITASLHIYPDLEALTRTNFGSWDSPLQAYFITRTGIFAGVLGSARAKTQRSPTRIYFAERPYFWKTIDLQQGEFYITYPYIDLLGKGVIFSVCRAVISAQVSNAIVCVDFPVARAVDVLKDRLKPFQLAKPVSLSCAVAADGDVENCAVQPSGEDDSHAVDLVNENLKKLNGAGNLDQITGAVFRLEGDGAYRMPLWKRGLRRGLKHLGLVMPGTAKGVMYFTVPAGKTNDKQGFLVYVIDVNAPQWSLLSYGIGFAFCLLLLALSLYYTHQARVLAMKFVDDLQRVMEISPVAFIHLNEDTHIVGSNPAFRLLSGYTTEHLRKRTLSSILSKRSGLRYSKVAEFRQQYLMTNPYEVELVCANGHKEKLIVQGAPLHMPPGKVARIISPRKGARDAFALPHTFGILVSPSQVLGRYVDLTIGDDLFAAALQVNLKEFADDADGTETST
jgi:PAS domain S-box-containing protein